MGMHFRGICRQHYSHKLTDRRDPIVRGLSIRAEHVWTLFSALGLGWDKSTGQDGLQPRRTWSGSPQNEFACAHEDVCWMKGALHGVARSTTRMVVSADRKHQSASTTVIQGPTWWQWLSSLGSQMVLTSMEKRRGGAHLQEKILSWVGGMWKWRCLWNPHH